MGFMPNDLLCNGTMLRCICDRVLNGHAVKPQIVPSLGYEISSASTMLLQWHLKVYGGAGEFIAETIHMFSGRIFTKTYLISLVEAHMATLEQDDRLVATYHAMLQQHSVLQHL